MFTPARPAASGQPNSFASVFSSALGMGHIAAVSDRSGGAETVPSAVPATEVLSAQVSELDTSSSACSRLAFAKMTGLWRTRLGIPHILALSQPCVREIRARLARKLCGGSRGATCASQTESWRCRGMATCPCGMCGKYFCINCVQTYEETDGSLTHLCGRCVDAIMNDSQDRRECSRSSGAERVNPRSPGAGGRAGAQPAQSEGNTGRGQWRAHPSREQADDSD